MEQLIPKVGQPVKVNVNNLSPTLLQKIKMDIERNKKGVEKSG